MPELHVKQPIFTYSNCGPVTKHCEWMQKYREKGNLKYLYRMNQAKLVLLMLQHILIVMI